MKKGVLLYEADASKLNEWFISKLISDFKTLGVNLELLLVENIDNYLFDDVDFAIARTNNYKVNLFLEEKKIKVFNNKKTSFIANDKWQTHLFCKSVGIKQLKTQKLDENSQNLIFPKVVKSVNGHGGKQVFFINNHEELEKVLVSYRKTQFIAQEPSKTLGEDMRVYVLGDKILACVLRKSKSDFRSNFSLGGEVLLVEPCEYQKKVVNIITKELSCDFVGIDFIRNGDEWVLNEIEDPVGTRMLYKTSSIDVCKVFAEYVCKRI